MKNPCIVTYFMGNILDKTPELQRAVVEKFNKSKVPLYQVKGQPTHGQFIDYFWTVNGAAPDYMSSAQIKQELDHDVILILDIDCIPLSEHSIDYYLEQAAAGKIIGNVQRSNHIENDQHLFAAPSAIALSRETFLKRKKNIQSGTTFGTEEHGPLYYHNFQIAHPGNQEMFWARCEKALNE